MHMGERAGGDGLTLEGARVTLDDAWRVGWGGTAAGSPAELVLVLRELVLFAPPPLPLPPSVARITNDV
jgi:hypothetical protein